MNVVSRAKAVACSVEGSDGAYGYETKELSENWGYELHARGKSNTVIFFEEV